MEFNGLQQRLIGPILGKYQTGSVQKWFTFIFNLIAINRKVHTD